MNDESIDKITRHDREIGFALINACLTQFVHWINVATAWICGGLVGVIVVVTLLQVVFRYILLEPLIWSEEIARFLLVWLTFLGGGLGIAKGLHPSIDLLTDMLPERARAGLRILLGVLILGFLTVLVVVGYQLAEANANYTALGSGLSQAVPRYALPIGGLVMGLNVIARVVTDLRIITGCRMKEDSLS